jgi:hypothetical protein
LTTFARDGRVVTADDDVELRGCSNVGTPEHRRGHIREAMRPVTCVELARQLNGDRGHVHVHEPFGRALEQTVDHGMDRVVVGEHREHDVSAECLARRRDRDRPEAGERVHRLALAIPHPYAVPGFDEIRGDARAHGAEANEADVHHDVIPGRS